MTGDEWKALPSVVLLAGGSSLHARKWARALADRGHRVAMTSWVTAEPLDRVDLRVAPGAGRARRGRAGAAWQFLTAGWWLRRQLRAIGPDVVHVHSVGMAGLFSLLLPRDGVRVVTPWGVDLQTAARSRVRGWVAGAALRQADLVMPTSDSVTEDVIERYRVPRSRAVTVSWGVDDDLVGINASLDRAAVRREFGIPVAATVILSARTAGPVYRTADTVRAFAQIADRRPDTHLVVLRGHRPAEVGSAQAQQRDIEEADRLAAALPGRVTVLTGTLAPESAYRLMCVSDVAVSVPRHDQRSCTVLEAALAGCRLVLADLPAYHEMIADGLAADLVPEPLADRLPERLLTARPLDAEAQRRNRHFVQTVESWSRQVGVVQQWYRRLTGYAEPEQSRSPG